MKLGISNLLVAALVVVLAGCSDAKKDGNRPARVPVSGKVLHNGAPVAGANVTFVPQSGKDAASARTDSEGNFKLTTFEEGDGAVPGSYKVTVTKYEEQQAAAAPQAGEPGYDPTAKPLPPPKNLLPAKYAKPETTELSQTVAEGQSEITIELK